jgi:hypothetical protein
VRFEYKASALRTPLLVFGVVTLAAVGLLERRLLKNDSRD